MYELVSRFGGSYGGLYVLFVLASPSKISTIAEIRRMAAFFGRDVMSEHVLSALVRSAPVEINTQKQIKFK